MKEFFTAKKGEGAFLNNERIKVSSEDQDICLIFDPFGGKVDSLPSKLKIAEKLSELGRIKLFGSYGLNYAYVACGRAQVAVGIIKDVFPEFAGKLLVEEAGGKFTDFQENTLTLETREVVASNGILHDEVLKLLARVMN